MILSHNSWQLYWCPEIIALQCFLSCIILIYPWWSACNNYLAPCSGAAEKLTDDQQPSLTSFRELGISLWLDKVCSSLGMKTATAVQRGCIPAILQVRHRIFSEPLNLILGCSKSAKSIDSICFGTQKHLIARSLESGQLIACELRDFPRSRHLLWAA